MNENENWPEVGKKCNGGGGCLEVRKESGVYVIEDTKTKQCLVASKGEYRDLRRRMLDGYWPLVLLRLLKRALPLAQAASQVVRLGKCLLGQFRG
jgi:hypothetical protein